MVTWMFTPSGVTGPVHRPIDHPAATITGAGNQYMYSLDMTEDDFQEWLEVNGKVVVPGSATWPMHRPSPTVVGLFNPEVVAAPGYRTEVSRQKAPGSVRVTVQEAGILQSFPADYDWQGGKTAQYLQVGNAVPPLVVTALAEHLIGGELDSD